MERVNLDSIRTVGDESRSCRRSARKKARGYSSVRGMGRNLKVLLRKPVITCYFCEKQACSSRALAKSFCDHSASSSMAFHAGDHVILAA
eukprot:scaffold128430_cov19-Tisochrysis_lutea.AAC.2